MITLKEITTEDMFDECVCLEMYDGQDNYCADNVYSLAQAWFDPNARPMCIYKNETMVGFVMLEYLEDKKECGIWRFMIDKKYQNMGYGTEAMAVVLAQIKANLIFEIASVNWHPDNLPAVKVYSRAGFVPETGVPDEDGEIRTVLSLARQ